MTEGSGTTPAFLRQFATDWLAAWNSHDTERVLALLHPDIVWEDTVFWTEVIEGHEGMRTYVERIWEAMPDVRFTEIQLFTAPEDGRALVLFTQEGSGPAKLDPTKRFSTKGCDVFLAFADGLLSRYLAQYEITDMLRQLGALPPREGRIGGAYLLSLLGSGTRKPPPAKEPEKATPAGESGYRYLITSVADGVGILQLNHPEKRNALGWELHRELIAALRAWEDDDAVAAVLLVGNEEFFCAGWALDVLQGTGDDERTRFVDLAHRLMIALLDYRKPTVAAVAGVAPGYGMDLANMCDITVASENAAFGSTQVKYAMNGFYHGMVRKVGAQRARRMLFTGDPIDAREAYRVGLVDELVPVGTVRESGLRLARQIAEAGPELSAVLKEVALRAGEMDHVGATAYELRVTADLVARGLFTRRVADGLDRLRAGKSRATERLER